MAQYLLDASVLIDWLNGRRQAVELLDGLVRRGEVLAVNAIAIAETFSGLSAEDRELAEPVLRTLEFWDIDFEVARLAGTYRYTYARSGRPLSVPDVLMAAHAVARDAALVTGNVRDFPMPELRLLKLPPLP
ncbi:MAG TPA: PIN domain-containing protein [Dehalococcoidia bacterium]|nr:PIN domain-containing protein [Dehalococcoidia bacterium]